MPRVAPSVEQLVAAAQSGEPGAVATLFAHFQPLVRRLLQGYRDLPVAEDLPGETYLAFAHLVARYDATRGIPFPHFIRQSLPWALHTIVRRDCRYRAREIPVHHEDLLVESADSNRTARGGESAGRSGLPDFAARLEFGETLRRLLARLPPRQADVFVRRAIEGEEYPEIATALGNSPKTVRVLYATARQRLRQTWGEMTAEES